MKSVPEIKNFKVGLLHLFIQHTSAGLAINESTPHPLQGVIVLINRNWDADVRKDMIDALDKLAPEKANYRHNAEGSDDMVSPPTKQRLFGVLTLAACTYKVGSYGDECDYTYFGRQVGVGDMAGDISLRVQEKCSSKNVSCYYPGRTVIL